MNAVGRMWNSAWHDLQSRLALGLGAGAPVGRLVPRDPGDSTLKTASWIGRAHSGGHNLRQEAQIPK
jgi:hypothetical protein